MFCIFHPNNVSAEDCKCNAYVEMSRLAMRIIHIYPGILFHFISKSVLSYKISKSNLELDSKLG